MNTRFQGWSGSSCVFRALGQFPFKLEDGTELPAYGYRVKDAVPGGHSVSGHVETDVVTGN